MSEQKVFEPMMTEEEILVLTQVSQSDAPHSQRAQALLAFNEGKTLEEAGTVTGLRPTQVKYWVSRYKTSGMAIFPESLLAQEIGEEVAGEAAIVAANETIEETAVSPDKSAATHEEQAPVEQKDQDEKKEKKRKKEKKKKSKSKKKEKEAKKVKSKENKEKANKKKKKEKKKKEKKLKKAKKK